MRKSFIILIFISIMAFSTAGLVYAYASEPVVTHGSADDYGSLSDTFRGVAKMDNENFDEKVLSDANKSITTLTGTIVSIILYLIFAMTAFTTACDLLYIGFPPIRPYLYDGGLGRSKYGSENVELEGRDTFWSREAADDMRKANIHGYNARAYQQQAQQRAMMGDMDGARRAMSDARFENDRANWHAGWVNKDMNYQAQSDARRAAYNSGRIERAQRDANTYAK